jgi:heme/copper-type cytochrome/quinol oxidase subunit 2
VRRAIALALLAAWPLAAQCVMCARTAAAQNAERIRLLQLGIVVILVPVISIFCGLLYLAWRRRNVCGEPSRAEPVNPAPSPPEPA